MTNFFNLYYTAEAVFGCGIFKADQNRLDDSATLTDIFKQYLRMCVDIPVYGIYLVGQPAC